MDKSKIKYIIVIIAILILAFIFINKGIDNKEDTVDKSNTPSNLLEMTIEEQKTFTKNLVKSVINDDFSTVRDKIYLLESQCYYDITRYAYSSNITEGNLSTLVCDYVEPQNSSTKDSVIFCNAKIWFEDASYNMIYTFEFHVNENGMIYGYNIWVH